MKMNAFEISWATLWKITFFSFVVAILFQGRHILLGLFVAIVISAGLETIVNFLERIGLPRTFGVILVFLLVILTLTILLYAVLPILINELYGFVATINKVAADFGFGSLLNLKSVKTLNNLLTQLSPQLFAVGASPFIVLSQILGGIGLLLAVFATSFYLTLSRDGIPRFIKAVFPADYEEGALRIYERSRRKIGLWFRTQMLLSLIMGVLVWIALLILGVEHAFLIAALTAVFEVIPFVGPILSGAVAVATALTVSFSLAVYTLLVFLGLQQLENHILVPFLSGRTVGLHPVVVIIALLIGAEVAGLLGIIVAAPAAAVIQEIIEEWTIKKRSRMPAA